MSRRLGILIRDLVEALVLAVLLYVGLQLVVQNSVVEGHSMEPNFADRELLLVNKLAYRWAPPSRGDVIVFYAPDAPGKEFIKRVIGLPGEVVEIRGGLVHLNGRVFSEPWEPITDRMPFGPYRVPEGQVFVLGDNRPNSNDSRTWGGDGGALSLSSVVGKVWLRLWPRDRWGVVHAASPAAGH